MLEIDVENIVTVRSRNKEAPQTTTSMQNRPKSTKKIFMARNRNKSIAADAHQNDYGNFKGQSVLYDNNSQERSKILAANQST